MRTVLWFLLAWASITVTHAQIPVHYLPSNHARGQPTQDITNVSNFPAICSIGGGLPGLDLARGYLGSDTCPGNAVSQMLPNRADYNEILLIDDTRPMTSYLLSQLDQQNALQTFGNRQIVKPTTVSLWQDSDNLTVLVVGDMAYRKHQDPNRWFRMLEDSMLYAPNADVLDRVIAEGTRVLAGRREAWARHMVCVTVMLETQGFSWNDHYYSRQNVIDANRHGASIPRSRRGRLTRDLMYLDPQNLADVDRELVNGLEKIFLQINSGIEQIDRITGPAGGTTADAVRDIQNEINAGFSNIRTIYYCFRPGLPDI